MKSKGGHILNLTIYFDMDETLVNLVDPWLDILNAKLGNGYSFTREDIDMYDMTKVVPLSVESVLEPFHRPRFWENLPPLPGAVEIVRELHDQGHNIYIATKPFRSDNCAWEKRLWVEDNLPFLDPEHNLIMLRHKHLLQGHVMVDDYPPNISRFNGMRVLIDRPWNRNLRDMGWYETWFTRVKSWNDLRSALTVRFFR